MSSMERSDTEAPWQQLAPWLDDAMNELAEADRRAILLRFFAHKPLREIGEALGVGEDAARMRINRALEKLHGLLVRKGATCSSAALAGLLAERAVHAAPPSIARSVEAAALAAAKIGPSFLLGLLALMTKAKLKSIGLVGVGLIVGFTAALLIRNRMQQPDLVEGQTTSEVQQVEPPRTAESSLVRSAPPGEVPVVHRDTNSVAAALNNLRRVLFATTLENAYPSAELVGALQALRPDNIRLAVPLLIEALQNEGTNVQRRAASALDYLAGSAKEGRWPKLPNSPFRTRPPTEVEWEAIDGSALHTALLAALPGLREKLCNPTDSRVLHPALRAATTINQHADLLPDVVEAMKTLQQQRAAITTCVEAFAQHPSVAANLLQPLLSSPDEGVRIAAASCYAGLPGSHDSSTLEILTQGLGKDRGDLQILDSIKKLGADAKPYVPAMLERAQFMFRDDGSYYVWQLKDRYCSTLMAIDPELRWKLPELEQWHREQEQLNLLKARVAHPAVTIPELTAALDYRETRYDALKRLGEMGPAAAEALPALREALKQASKFAEGSDELGSRSVSQVMRKIDPDSLPPK